MKNSHSDHNFEQKPTIHNSQSFYWCDTKGITKSNIKLMCDTGDLLN